MNVVFRPHLCRYKLNWGWWDEWDDTALQIQDSKFEPWRSEVEYASSRSRKLPTILNLYEWAGKTFCFFETWRPEWGFKPAISRLSKQADITSEPDPGLITYNCDLKGPLGMEHNVEKLIYMKLYSLLILTENTKKAKTILKRRKRVN